MLSLLASAALFVAISSADQTSSAPPNRLPPTWNWRSWQEDQWKQQWEKARKERQERWKTGAKIQVLTVSFFGALAALLSCCRRVSRRLYGLPAHGMPQRQVELRATWYGLVTAAAVLGMVLIAASLIAGAVTCIYSAHLDRW